MRTSPHPPPPSLPPLPPLAAFERVLRVIWVAILTGTLTMGGVAFLVTQTMPPGAGPGILRDALGLLAAVAWTASILLPRTVFSPENLARTSQGDPQRHRNSVQVMSILSFALAEVVSIFGLVLALMSANAEAWVPFGVGAVFALVLLFPRCEPHERAFREAHPTAPR